MLAALVTVSLLVLKYRQKASGNILFITSKENSFSGLLTKMFTYPGS